jgi:hypothetical protein
MDDNLMVEKTEQQAVFGAGLAAVLLVPDVVNFTGGGGLVAAAGPPAALVPQRDRVADPGRDRLAVADVRRQARPAQPGAELRRRRNDASPPGPDSRSTALPTVVLLPSDHRDVI